MRWARSSTLAAVFVALVAAVPVGAWTQLYNNYPGNPVGCTNVGQWQCIQWPLAPNGFSSTAFLSRGTTRFPDSWAETTFTIAANGNTILGAGTVYNQSVPSNRNFHYETLVADARKVSAHELGDIEALGHTGFNTPMKQGAEPGHRPQRIG